MNSCVKVTNETKQAILANQGKIAQSFFKRLKGLLGKDGLKDGEGLIIQPNNSVHTFFMRFPIDILFVTRNHQIVKTIPDLKPYRATRIYPKAYYVVELPVGTIEKTNTQEGDFLKIEQM